MQPKRGRRSKDNHATQLATFKRIRSRELSGDSFLDILTDIEEASGVAEETLKSRYYKGKRIFDYLMRRR